VSEARAIGAELDQQIAAHLNDGHRGERLRAGLHLAIIGPPNAGKSSLLNRLAKRDAAIVSDIAGTTRDIVEVFLDLGGYPVIATDTAGLREARDSIETEGVRRARERAGNADIKLTVFDATDLDGKHGLDPLTLELVDDDTLVVLNKADLVVGFLPGHIEKRPAFAVSAKTGSGLIALLDAVQNQAAKLLVGEGAGLTRHRHRSALNACRAALARAAVAQEPELMGEDLRMAARELGRITGRVDVEDLLGVIFSEFCIGK